MAKSIEPEVKNWFAQALSQHKTKYCIEQGTLNIEIESALKAAPSKSGGNGYGRPDFQLMVKDPTTLKSIPVMVEAKGTKGKLLKLTKLGEVELETAYLKDSKEGAANPHKAGDTCYTTIQSYAVNSAVFYARNIIEYSDSYNAVIAVGINGYDDTIERKYQCEIYYVSKENAFVPKRLGNDIQLLFKENIPALMEAVNNATLTDAEKERLTKNAETQIDDNLKRLNQMMHDGLHIEANSRVHLMAGMIMAGLGVEGKVAALELSDLHGYTTASGHDGRVFMNRITDFLRERGLPEEKREIVLNKLSTVFVNAQGLWMPENGVSRLKTLYAEVQHTILPYARTKGSQYLDFTGRLFNVLTDWVTIPDGDKNDVVLTPRYITNLMARLCEVDRDSYVWDYATGTAGFLVSSMRLMIEDADAHIGDLKEREIKKRDIRCKQLLGIELRDDIYLLAVLNMILMGDGSTNIIMGDSLKYDGTYQQGDMKGKKFPATKFLLNPPYSAPGKGFNFVKKALSNMTTGKAAVLIQENAGSGQGLPFTKDILENNTLIASIHCADIFCGKAGVQTAIYLFEVGKPHDVDKKVVFIDMSNDGYARQNRKKASSDKNLQNKDHAVERYNEIVDIILDKRKKTDYYREGQEVIRDTISLNGDDWTFASHKKIDTTPTEEDFKAVVAAYLSYRVKCLMENK